MALTVAITGAAGELGAILRGHFNARGWKVVPIVRSADEQSEDLAEARVADLTVAASVHGLFDGAHVLVHLAASPKPWETYETMYANNMVVDYNVFAEAARAGVQRVVYASTNHVNHGSSMKSTPETLNSRCFGAHLPGSPPTKLDDDPDPDSYYAISKLLGENLGKLFARKGLEFVAVRIGWIVPEDDPRNARWVATDDNKEFMRAMWLSHRDCDEIFSRCVSAPLPLTAIHGAGKFVKLYAVSNNSRRVFDLDATVHLLGYMPQDDVDTLVSESWAHIG